MVSELFKSKNFLITGVGSGIGRGLAWEAEALGASVYGVDLFPPQDIPTTMRLSFFHGDITDEERMGVIAEQLRTQSITIDYLVLAAGIGSTHPKEKILSVNSGGTRISYSAFNGLLVQRATVIFLSSDLINLEDPATSAYVQSKKEVSEFAQILARERTDLRALTLLPGPVDTPLFRGNKPQEVINRIRDEHGILSPEEFAGIILRQVLSDQVLSDLEAYPGGSQIRIYKNILEKLA
ncbi:SDR family oxidoreductase [Candidatus Daviesbacteria bacterium]|nr:SDR family oxidoreductase [Candidatus Daviesbacteria bacterium]